MKQKLVSVAPVLPSQDIERDVAWYKEKTGFRCVFSDTLYAGLERDGVEIHLQWHADSDDDPLLGGSVIRIFVNDILPIFDEFKDRKIVDKEKLRLKTPWGTNEFGFYDLNRNAIFIVENL